ncbi:MAG: hypothetical protein JXA20_12305 [Spirochaetes bacterium]|nr:hypothetical protein [Spirochaetota bacterium]
MGRGKTKKELLSRIRSGIRLRVKPPKEEVPKKGVYRRTEKHKRRLDDETSSFFFITSSPASQYTAAPMQGLQQTK